MHSSCNVNSDVIFSNVSFADYTLNFAFFLTILYFFVVDIFIFIKQEKKVR